MKAQFTLHTAIENMLGTSGYDVAKIVNSVQSELNKLEMISEESKLGNAKITDKGETAKNSETITASYQGKATTPLVFKAWHDAVAGVFKKHGAPHAELNSAIIPEPLSIWLADKFVANAGKAANASAKGNRAERRAAKNGAAKGIPAIGTMPSGDVGRAVMTPENGVVDIAK